MSQRSKLRLEKYLKQRDVALQERERALSVVQQAVDTSDSKQPRFSSTSPVSIFTSIYNLARCAALNKPADNASTREWDAWYRDFAMSEPFLSGVLNSVVQIDKNRGWTLTGGRNQVARFTDKLHGVDEGQGWREYCSWQAQSFYSTRMGYVSEIGRDGDQGPLSTLWSVDPSHCQLTGNVDTPLRYYPRLGGQQDWLPSDYFRSAALVSTNEKEYGLGNPAIRRCLYLAEILIAVYEHDQEQLGARAPKGLLLLNGINERQWDDAMKARDESLDSLERKYYGGVAVLASMGADEVQASLVALSQLPANFDMQKMTDLAMYGFALAFGYDAREFWPVSSGGLGTGNEVVTGHRKTSSKGELDFSLSLQENLQRELPESLEFAFERRDDEGEKLSAETQLSKAQVITEMTKWTIDTKSVLTPQQILQLAAEEGIIPDEWSAFEEDVTSTDTEDAERANPYIQRAAKLFPHEPIVRYDSTTNRTRILFRDGLYPSRKSFPVVRRSIDDVVSQFHSDLHDLCVLGFTSDSSILSDMRRLVKDGIADAYIAGLEDGGVSTDEMDADDAKMIIELTSEQLEYVTDFVRAIREAKQDKEKQRDILDNRVNLWTASVNAAGQAGLSSAQKNEMVTWKLGQTEEHCQTCNSLNNQSHRRQWFARRGYWPQKPGCEALDCRGYNCLCTLE